MEIGSLVRIHEWPPKDGKRSIWVQINCNAEPWSAPRHGKKGLYSPHCGYKKAMKSFLKKALVDTGKEINDFFLKGALRFDVIFYQKNMGKNKEKLYPTNKPDRTNLAKLCEDIFEGIFFKNDSYIVDGNIGKRYGDKEKIEVKIEEL